MSSGEVEEPTELYAVAVKLMESKESGQTPQAPGAQPSTAPLGAMAAFGDNMRSVRATPVAATKTNFVQKMPDKILLQIFSFLHHREVLKCSKVCARWRTIAQDSRLWSLVSLRPEFDGLQVSSPEALLTMVTMRFAEYLRLIELPMDLITPPILHELAAKCPKLQHLTIDFSNAMQLHDFNDLHSFPARLRSLTICLSAVIFLEGFIRKIYTFISSVEVLHLIGTYERVEDEEMEVYEVLNIVKLKTAMPNLKVVNFFGVTFVNDDHVEALSTSCAHLECLSVSFCQRITGSSLKLLLQRCKRLKCLLLEQTSLKNQNMMAADWERSNIQELNITATDLSTECIISLLTRLPQLRWLNAAYLEGFTDQVLEAWVSAGTCANISVLDLNTCDSITLNTLQDFLFKFGRQLQGLNVGGLPALGESFWITVFPYVRRIKSLVMGVGEDCCSKMKSRVHIDQFLSALSEHCTRIERLELRWDPDTLRFSDRSSKFIDILRVRCLNLRAFVLTDGKYYELVKSNFERASRPTVIRTTTSCPVTMINFLQYYKDLLFN